MKIGFVSDVGRERPSNEDSIVIVRNDAMYESQKVQTTVPAVAD